MLDREVVERLGELLAKATQYPAWGWPDPVPSRHGTDHFVIGDAPPYLAAVKRKEDADLIAAMHRALPDLLRVYRMWMDAPVVDVWGGYDEYGITFRADSETGELAAFQDSRLAGKVVRLVRDGDSGEGES